MRPFNLKILAMLVLTAMSMVACMQDYVMEIPEGKAIMFDGAFVEKATRTAQDPSISNGELNAFDVWGFVKEYDGTVFVDQDVTLDNGVWTYNGTQYWVPDQPYYFAALAPMNSDNIGHTLAVGEAAKHGLGILTFTNVDGTEDLLYAHDSMVSKKLTEAEDAVQLQFQHLLSKVKFTFRNGFITDNAFVQVRNIRMTVSAKASINVAQSDYSKAWSLEDEKVILEFGDVVKLGHREKAECADERLTIPASSSYVYDIAFDVDLFMGQQLVYTVGLTSVVTGVELEMGKAYNFTADITPESLDLDNVTFDVINVDRWTPAQ